MLSSRGALGTSTRGTRLVPLDTGGAAAPRKRRDLKDPPGFAGHGWTCVCRPWRRGEGAGPRHAGVRNPSWRGEPGARGAPRCIGTGCGGRGSWVLFGRGTLGSSLRGHCPGPPVFWPVLGCSLGDVGPLVPQFPSLQSSVVRGAVRRATGSSAACVHPQGTNGHAVTTGGVLDPVAVSHGGDGAAGPAAVTSTHEAAWGPSPRAATVPVPGWGHLGAEQGLGGRGGTSRLRGGVSDGGTRHCPLVPPWGGWRGPGRCLVLTPVQHRMGTHRGAGGNQHKGVLSPGAPMWDHVPGGPFSDAQFPPRSGGSGIGPPIFAGMKPNQAAGTGSASWGLVLPHRAVCSCGGAPRSGQYLCP